MASKEKNQKEEGKKTDDFEQSKDASYDFPVEVEATEADPYHKTGTKFQASSKKAEELKERGWVKMIAILVMLFAGLTASAQNNDFYNALGSGLKSDTVTNTGTATVTTRALPQRPFASCVIWITVVKQSGTVGGTITLQGSIDGVTFKALNTNDTQTALATITATDASNTYHYRLLGGAFPYYRVSWTGTGTMAATVAAKIFRN